MSPPRIPPIHGLLAFEAVARLGSVTLAGEELSVTRSAVSHRIRQLEQLLGIKLFQRGDFTLTPEGAAYLTRVRDALAALAPAAPPGRVAGRTPLRVAVPPTFSREVLLPRLPDFYLRYPDVDLILQVAIPVGNVLSEEADLELRFGAQPAADRESLCLMPDRLGPVCSPDYVRAAGPFTGFLAEQDFARARLIRCPLEPWRSWFQAHGVVREEPADGAQFNDLGLVLEAAAAGLGVALMRLELARAWLANGRLVRLSEESVPSPQSYFLCWKPGALNRWECAGFLDWLVKALAPWNRSH